MQIKFTFMGWGGGFLLPEYNCYECKIFEGEPPEIYIAIADYLIDHLDKAKFFDVKDARKRTRFLERYGDLPLQSRQIVTDYTNIRCTQCGLYQKAITEQNIAINKKYDAAMELNIPLPDSANEFIQDRTNTITEYNLKITMLLQCAKDLLIYNHDLVTITDDLNQPVICVMASDNLPSMKE